MSTSPSASPPSSNVVNLAYAECVLAGILIPLVGYIGWRHWLAGFLCYQVYLTGFAARLISIILLLLSKDKPLVPTLADTALEAVITACMTMGIIGMIFEANLILPQQSSKWTNRIIFMVAQLATAFGVSLSNNGGTPDPTKSDGIRDQRLNKIGYFLVLFTLLIICGWMWPTYQKVNKYRGMHPNAQPARVLFFAAAAATPIWLTRIVYMIVHTFHLGNNDIDPVVGVFAVMFVLRFLTFWGTGCMLTAGGWFALSTRPECGFLKAREAGGIITPQAESPRSDTQSTTPEMETVRHVVQSKFRKILGERGT